MPILFSKVSIRASTFASNLCKMGLPEAGSLEVDEKFAKYDKKIDAVRKKATARLDNRMSGSSDPDSSVTTLRG
ncbi:hypothetical protein E4U48_004761 [Claviceps purpurea]|nr:hypothetical protein E4U48_004761 [Claviceps purpurea]